ncbi:MAG: MFS transporter [Hyphomicrobiales bacterium]
MTSFFQRNATIIAAITALACCNIAFGLLVQLVPLSLDARGLPASTIGLNTAMGQAGVFITGFSLPFLYSRVQGKQIVLSAIVLLLVAFLAFALLDPVWPWHVARFACGLAVAALFTTSETWIQTEAGHARRGRIMGIYMTVLTSTFGVGPFLISWLGIEGFRPWGAAIACFVAGLIAMLAIRVNEAAVGEKPAGFLRVLKQAPMIFVCVGVTTLFEAVMLSFIAIFALRHGFTQGGAAQLIGVGIAGCVALFYPIGQLSDRWSRSGTVILCAAVATLGSFALLPTISSVLVWPLIVLQRAGAFGVYGVGLTSVGDTFQGAELVSASALVAILWGLGGIIGPPAAGKIIDLYGVDTLPIMLGLCYLTVLAGLIITRGRVAPSRTPATAS